MMMGKCIIAVVSEEQHERSLVQLDGVRIVDDLWEDGDWDKNKKLLPGQKNPPFINGFIKAPSLQAARRSAGNQKLSTFNTHLHLLGKCACVSHLQGTN